MKRITLLLLLVGLQSFVALHSYAQEQQKSESTENSGDDKSKEPEVPKMESKAGGGSGGKEDLIRDGDRSYKHKTARQMKREERRQRKKYEKLRKKQTRATEKRMIKSEGRSTKINDHNEMPFYKRWFKHSKESMTPRSNNREKSAFGRFWYSITHPFGNKKRHQQQKGEFKTH